MKRDQYKIIYRYPEEDVAVPEELLEEQLLNWMEFVILNYSVENKIENKHNSED